MSLEEDILVVVSVLVIDCNLRNERERERERERDLYKPEFRIRAGLFPGNGAKPKVG